MDWNRLRAVEIWAALEPEIKTLAARALYARERGGSATRKEADAAIAQALRFRESALRQMPVGRRVAYLTRAVRPDESLAASLLLDLHLEERRPLLASFLDALGIPHRDGLIDEDHRLEPPPVDRLAFAVSGLYDRFPGAEVDLYLASLVVLDPDTWAGVIPARQRTSGEDGGRTDRVNPPSGA